MTCRSKSLTPDQLQVGLTRLLYPFFCGLLLSRMQWLINVKGGFWWCALLILVLLCMPWMGIGTEGDSRWTNGLYEALCILVAFPLIVSIGAFVLSILMAYGAYKLYDLPVREWLRRKIF